MAGVRERTDLKSGHRMRGAAEGGVKPPLHWRVGHSAVVVLVVDGAQARVPVPQAARSTLVCGAN